MANKEQNAWFANIENSIAQLTVMFENLTEQVKTAIHTTPSSSTLPTPVTQAKATEEHPYVSPVVVELDPITDTIAAKKEDENNKRFAKREEKLRSIQGYEAQAMEDLSHFAKLDFPKKFKISKFTKYDGTGDPRIHLKYYLMRIGRYAENVPLLIQTFQESLFEPALQWFILQEPDKIEKWKELAEAFIHQYNYNTEMAPTKEELVRVDKKRSETFRSFAQCCRTIVAQVQSLLNEKEMMDLFPRTLPYKFFNRMLSSGRQTFPHLVSMEKGSNGPFAMRRWPKGVIKSFQ